MISTLVGFNLGMTSDVNGRNFLRGLNPWENFTEINRSSLVAIALVSSLLMQRGETLAGTAV
ncbi:hypothetical protein NG795_26240 [Laspinema sp. D3]|nr:hypothetical protein [Laspinema sp. D2c]